MTLRLFRAGLLAGHHVEHVGRVAERGIAAELSADEARPSMTFCMWPMMVGIFASSRLDLRRFASRRVVLAIRIGVAEDADGGAEHVHRHGAPASSHRRSTR